MIREAVEECNFSGNILKETDNPEKHKRDILTIHMMRREFEVFDSCLKTLPGREYRITYDYIHKDRKVSEIAEGEQRNDQAFRENESRRSNEGTINKKREQEPIE